jgi:uncharacterized protein (DUF4415 family)
MRSRTDWKRLNAMPDDEIDTSDIPPINAHRLGKMEIRMPQPKELVSIRIDPDVLAWFRRRGRRYQTRMNAVLRAYVESHRD